MCSPCALRCRRMAQVLMRMRLACSGEGVLRHWYPGVPKDPEDDFKVVHIHLASVRLQVHAQRTPRPASEAESSPSAEAPASASRRRGRRRLCWTHLCYPHAAEEDPHVAFCGPSRPQRPLKESREESRMKSASVGPLLSFSARELLKQRPTREPDQLPGPGGRLCA